MHTANLVGITAKYHAAGRLESERMIAETREKCARMITDAMAGIKEMENEQHARNDERLRIMVIAVLTIRKAIRYLEDAKKRVNAPPALDTYIANASAMERALESIMPGVMDTATDFEAELADQNFQSILRYQGTASAITAHDMLAGVPTSQDAFNELNRQLNDLPSLESYPEVSMFLPDDMGDVIRTIFPSGGDARPGSDAPPPLSAADFVVPAAVV